MDKSCLKSYRIGIDVGGTFTNAALIDNIDGGIVGRSSVHTTHDHPDGVAAGVIQVFERVLGDAGVDAADVVLLCVTASTQATRLRYWRATSLQVVNLRV